MKRIFSMVTALTLAVSLYLGALPVYADEPAAPSDTQFATAEQLKAFNTSNWDQTYKAAKVYFAQTLNGETQKWWIAGNQRDGATLVLFADCLIEDDVIFEPSNNIWGIYKGYDPSSECTYYTGYGTQTPTEVPSRVRTNHYGTSQIRKRLKELENLLFTDTEKNYLITSTIYTRDEYESRQDINMLYYSTKDILYLPYHAGFSSDPAVYVGENRPSYNLLSGTLVVTSAYNNRDRYWTRKPYSAGSDGTRSSTVFYNGGWHDGVTAEYGLQPAFALDLTEVLFASAAHAAAADGPLQVDDDIDGEGAFTLRFQSNTLGAAEVSGNKQSVGYQNVPAGTYLVAQNSAGAWAKAVSGSGTVQASDMGSGFTSFENCQVWLETTNTDQRITYAAMADVLTAVTYNVTYKFVSGTDEKTLPPEVTALLPSNTTADEGTTVRPAAPSETTVTVTDGVWTFTGYNPAEASNISGDVEFTGTWTYAENSAITIAPADITIYMGGESGYEGALVDEETGVIQASHSLPTPGFIVTLPDALKDVNVTALTLVYQKDDQTTLEWTLQPYGGSSGSVYRIEPKAGSNTPVRMVFTNADGETITEDSFDVSKNMNQVLTMEVYGEAIDQDKVYFLNGDKVYPIAIGGNATVTVRGTTASVLYGNVEEAPGDEYAPKDPDSEKAIPGAAVTAGTVFTINGSDVQVGDNAAVSLLFDNIIDSNASANGQNYTQLLEQKAEAALVDIPVAEGKVRTYESRYLDLVDQNNGNAWVAAQDANGQSKAVTVYWPLPEGTDENTSFTLLHFGELHRSLTPEQIIGKLTDEGYAPETVEILRVTDTHVVFETTDFSPFALTWETDKPAPDPDPDPGKEEDGDNSDNGGSQNTTASSDKPVTAVTIPQTSDDSQSLVWVALVVISGAALAALAVYRKKRSDK